MELIGIVTDLLKLLSKVVEEVKIAVDHAPQVPPLQDAPGPSEAHESL